MEAEKKNQNIISAIEAILFACGNSVSISKLAEVLETDKKQIRRAVEEMKQQYQDESRGIELVELNESVQLCTKGSAYEYLTKIAKAPQKYVLTDTVLETLSIVAYKQPVTRGEIEKIRGVSCDHAINKLLEFDLIEEVGRMDAPGKPILFGTTEQFLRSFGVKSLGDLPTLSQDLVEEMKLQVAEEMQEKQEEVKVDV